MSVEPKPDLSEFAEFADTLRAQRVRSEQVVRRALARVSDRSPDSFSDELGDVSSAVNDALFAARVELEGAYALFRDFFELAPAAYVVTNPGTRILYANNAACALLGRRKNGLTGGLLISCVPLEHRAAFRSALVRSSSPGMVSDWPATLLSPDGGVTSIVCRMRVRAVVTPGTRSSSALYWNITEETDEDLF
jgi:PAS domain S-box-containing protein